MSSSVSLINPIYVAIDTTDLESALDLAKALRGRVGGIKLGLEFVYAAGPDGVRRVMDCARDQGDPVDLFMDLKLHDIPNTVAGAVRSVMPLRPGLLTIHAAGGAAMIAAARAEAVERAEALGCLPPNLLGVTVLTSLDQSDLTDIGVASDMSHHVSRMASLALRNGAAGLVCSPLEAPRLRSELGSEALLVTPGVRPAGSDVGDQKRVCTPADALAAGASRLVIGRPITQAADPAKAASDIARSLTTEAIQGDPT